MSEPTFMTTYSALDALVWCAQHPGEILLDKHGRENRVNEDGFIQYRDPRASAEGEWYSADYVFRATYAPFRHPDPIPAKLKEEAFELLQEIFRVSAPGPRMIDTESESLASIRFSVKRFLEKHKYL